MQAPVLTLLHGFTQHGSSWSELASLLPAVRIIAPDLGGTTMEDCERDLLEFWDREGVPRSHLAGYSMGGRLALFVATRQPGRLLSLTVISAHAGLEGEDRERRRERDEALAAEIESRGIEWFANHWSGLPLFAGLGRRGPGFQARVLEQRLQNSPEHLAAVLRGMGPGSAPSVWGELGSITIPALFIAGSEDGDYPELAERMAAAVPEGRAAIVPGAGHSVHLEDPKAAAGLLSTQLA